jgi:acyl carrier protein
MDKIVEILKNIRPEEDFTASSDFITDGLLDSFDIVNLVTDLDQAYAISIDGVDIVPENFRNLNTISLLLTKNGAIL